MRTRGGQRRESAFTLIELAMVIALIAILSAVILPEMRGTYGHARLRAGSRELVQACALAASRAVSFNSPHRVSLDSGSGRYRIEARARGGGEPGGARDGAAGQGGYVPLRGVAGASGELGRGIRVSFGSGRERSDDLGGVDLATEFEGDRESVGMTGGGSGAVTFYPDGTADRGEIVLRDEGGYGLVLRINPVTARVRVEEWQRR